MNEASPEIGGIETDIEYDISGFIDGIEGTLSKQYAYAPCWNRPVAGNKFKEGFEAVFGIFAIKSFFVEFKFNRSIRISFNVSFNFIHCFTFYISIIINRLSTTNY